MKKLRESFSFYCSLDGVKISLLVTVLSTIMFIIALLGINFKIEGFELFVIISLMIEVIYGVVLGYNLIRNRIDYDHLIPFLILNWFLGCYSLNVFISVFENLPVWVYLTNLLFCISNFYIYSLNKDERLARLFYFINGVTFWLVIYYVIFLIPLVPISIICILGLGLGFYGLVPGVVFFIHVYTLYLNLPKSRNNWQSFLAGMAIVLVAFIGFTIRLNVEAKRLSQFTVTKSFEKNELLPNYIVISQHLKPNFFNEILLKRDLVYVGSDDFFEFDGFDRFGREQFNERKTNNPFYNTAFAFIKKPNLTVDDCIYILKSNFDKRLETEEQLWSGEDLITKNIKEDVKIYPKNRLAYTEITMDVGCDKETWQSKEAIYSFQLPEGAVATSLSLWVNGVERKGVLTSKQKATDAYKQVVRVENRDPSLMQWREGNRVVVRIFPINKNQTRTFKCGFTIPLLVEGDQMKYKSLAITGPNLSNAETLSRFQVEGGGECTTSKDFPLTNGYHINESKGLDSWEATMPVDPQAFAQAFDWEGQTYSIKPMQQEILSYTPAEIILDLNSEWELKEVQDLLQFKGAPFYVYFNENKQQITNDNADDILEQFKDLHYSLPLLFDFPENSLVITKSGAFSANFEELKATKYLEKLKKGLPAKHLKVIAISNAMTPFWQTIKEQHYVDYLQSDVSHTLQMLNDHRYYRYVTSESRINVEPAQIAIESSPSNGKKSSQGSTHIYRLFAFGKVLNEQVQKDSLSLNRYVSLAEDANIVTPVSSLIVLETDKDYKDNKINKNVNTLGNASIDDVPGSPLNYQWIVVLLAIVLGYFKMKEARRKRKDVA
jgi:XrtN system VIT domain protein